MQSDSAPATLGRVREVQRTRVLVIDRHALVAESLAAGLRERGMTAVDVLVGDVLGILLDDAATMDPPEVAVVGLHGGSTAANDRLLRRLVDLGTKVLVLAGGDDPAELARHLAAGASGVFTTKQPLNDLVGYVMDAARGATLLSPVARTELLTLVRDETLDARSTRERFGSLTNAEEAVLDDLMWGRSPEDIARARFVAVSTVRSQIRSVLAKLGVNSQLAAVTLAFRSGWSAERALA